MTITPKTPAPRAPRVAATRAVRATPSSAQFAKPVKAAKPVAPARYKVITDIDDALFCARVSEALDNGYILYGNPAATYNGKSVILAQAVVLKKLPAVKKVAAKKAKKK